ncbi:MAG: hypothetical protein K9K38_01325 [Rhodoferax sp.]|nr:hypothetical protein [Rhodoferax sp.]
MNPSEQYGQRQALEPEQAILAKGCGNSSGTVYGGAGVWVPVPGYFRAVRAVRELCERYGGLLMSLTG